MIGCTVCPMAYAKHGAGGCGGVRVGDVPLDHSRLSDGVNASATLAVLRPMSALTPAIRPAQATRVTAGRQAHSPLRQAKSPGRVGRR